MLRRRILLNLAVFTAVAAFMTYWAVTNVISFEFIERPYRVTADFENAMGVLPNAEVTYLGTQVGLVESVDRRDDAVRVTMKIDRGKRIPRDTTAHIWRKSALGEQYIDFTPAEGYDGGGPYFANGQHVAMERTGIPIEFADMLRAADELLSSIDPADLKVLTHELGTALVGRADDLRSLIVEGERFSAALAARTDALDRLATNNTRLTRVLADHSRSLERSVASLRAVMESVDGVKGEFGPLVDRGSELLGELLPVIRDHRDSLACLLDAVGEVVRIGNTPARLAGLERLIEDLPPASNQLKAATDIEEGPDGLLHQWVRMDLVDTEENSAVDHVPNKETPPEVNAVPACNVDFGTTSEVGAAAVASSEAAAGPPGERDRDDSAAPPIPLTAGLGSALIVGTTFALRRRRPE